MWPQANKRITKKVTWNSRLSMSVCVCVAAHLLHRREARQDRQIAGNRKNNPK